jgi:RNA methyltransferase, TrmH family
MLSKARVKFIKSLQLKKYRKQEQCFVVEGAKSVLEVLSSDYRVTMVVATPRFLQTHERALQQFQGELIETSERTLEELSEFKTNSMALAVVELKEYQEVTVHEGDYALVLDDIQDPGNLGTIIRTADWYGIETIIASERTADVYNGKVIQASMGSFTRVKMLYTHLATYLKGTSLPIMGAFLDGEDVHHFSFPSGGYVVIGNEGSGISPGVANCIKHRITINRFGFAESLNAGIATAVICDNMRRSLLKG